MPKATNIRTSSCGGVDRIIFANEHGFDISFEVIASVMGMSIGNDENESTAQAIMVADSGNGDIDYCICPGGAIFGVNCPGEFVVAKCPDGLRWINAGTPVYAAYVSAKVNQLESHRIACEATEEAWESAYHPTSVANAIEALQAILIAETAYRSAFDAFKLELKSREQNQ